MTLATMRVPARSLLVCAKLMAYLCGFILAVPAFASGTDIEQHTTVGGVETTTGDNSLNVGGSKAYSVGMGSIDVDIAQCLGSEATGILVVQWQRLKENPWCMAEAYDAKGLTHMAALMRCDIGVIRGHFSSDAACVEANTVTFHVEPEPVAIPLDHDDEDYDLLSARLSDLETQREKDAEALRKARSRPQPKPTVIKETVIEQRPFLSEEKRSRLQAILDE